MFAYAIIMMLISAALVTDTEATVITAAHNTTVNLTCIEPVDQHFPPAWVMDGVPTFPEDGYWYSREYSRNENTGELIGILTINGSRTCGTFNVHCLLRNGQTMHETTLTVEGLLPFPENIRINEENHNLLIEWNPPYSETNTHSSIIHVEPHITLYTVYIVDNYTGNYLDEVNITETSISFRRKTSDNHSCPMYGVTAWNAGGEGDMSVLLPGYLLRIPNSIAADQVVIQPGNGALHIRLHVTEPCTVRMPNYLLVTVMSTDRGNITTNVTVQHPVTRIRVPLPQNVDECKLIVRVRAQNSAGMSSATEIPVGCQATGTTATPTTRSTGIDTNATDPVDQLQQGDNNIIYIATGSGVAAVVMVVTVALLLIILWKCKPRTSKVKPPEEKPYIESPSPGGQPVDQPDSPPAYSPPVYSPPSPLAGVYTTSEAYRRTPSTESSGSDKPLLPSPKPTGVKSGIKVVQGMSGEQVTTGVSGVQITTGVGGVAISLQSSTTAYTRSGAQAPDGNPHLMYAQIDPTKHCQLQPPANDSQVQYAQIEYQDQL